MKLSFVIPTGVVTVALSAASAFTALSAKQAKPAAKAEAKSARKADVPQFQYDRTWPRPLPNVMKVGQVVGVAVDSRNHIWIVQRPGSLKNSESEAADGRYGGFTGAISGCCRPALPVVEFDQAGEMVQMWGGPQNLPPGFDWMTPGPKSPDTLYGGRAPFGERGIFVDFNDNVWLGADGPGDGFILKTSRFGRPLLQIGKKGQSKGSNDTQNLNGASGIVVDAKTNEVFVADGLHNRRVIVFDGISGKYLRHWGAFGKKPDDSVQMKPDAPDVNAPQFGDVHCIAMSTDNLLYVCDRVNNRVQVFKQDGTFVKQGAIAPETPGGTAYGIAFSPDPQQRFAYVVDGMNEKVWILDRDSMETVGSFGSAGHWGGQFDAAHSIATDQGGNVYVSETWEGKRVQRFLYKGLGPSPR